MAKTPGSNNSASKKGGAKNSPKGTPTGKKGILGRLNNGDKMKGVGVLAGMMLGRQGQAKSGIQKPTKPKK